MEKSPRIAEVRPGGIGSSTTAFIAAVRRNIGCELSSQVRRYDGEHNGGGALQRRDGEPAQTAGRPIAGCAAGT
ncbi:MAG: hypothetical protein ACLR8P_12725 [Clostridium fessum]